MFKRNAIVTIALAACAIFLAALNAADKLRPRAWLYGTVAPALRLSALVWELDRGEETRAALSRRLAERSMSLGRAEGYKRENDALRARLGLAVTVPYDMVYVRVAEKNPESWLKTLTLGAGRRAGVAPGMPVVGTEGLVGYVTAVSENGARVELITSERVRIAATHAPSGGAAVFFTDADGSCHAQYLPRTVDIRTGDMIVTGSDSALFPPGLILGYVTSYTRPFDSIYTDVEVTPAEDFNKLEAAFVLGWTPRPPGGLGP